MSRLSASQLAGVPSARAYPPVEELQKASVLFSSSATPAACGSLAAVPLRGLRDRAVSHRGDDASGGGPPSASVALQPPAGQPPEGKRYTTGQGDTAQAQALHHMIEEMVEISGPRTEGIEGMSARQKNIQRRG